MAIQAINTTDLSKTRKNNNQGFSNNINKAAQPPFQGLEQIPVAIADALTNGGFITSFIAQDFFGMAGPRVLEGINRRPVNKDTGKKEGPLNWKFARREGIREVLSGPSAFIIPSLILYFIKKYSGTANNVPVNMIQSLGNNFIEYASENPNTLDNVAKTKTEYYNKIFKNVLNTTLEGKLSEEELTKEANDFAERAKEIELAKDKKKPLWKVLVNKKVEGSPQDLTESLLDHFMELKKRYLSPSSNELEAEITFNTQKIDPSTNNTIIAKEKTSVEFKKLLKTMTDFTDDVITSTGEAMKKVKDGKFEPDKFLNSFVRRRTGSRILSNIGMWGAVVGFYALIPQLYSLGLNGENPAFATEKQIKKDGLTKKTASTATLEKNNISFSGKHQVFEKTSEYVLNSSKLKKFLNLFEFDNASMSVSAMMALLYGFCLPTRYFSSPDKYDKKETIVRDFTSFGAILFAANALSRLFSKGFEKFSGLSLNITPKDHNDSFYKKYIRDYFSPKSGINVLSNKELTSKYTHIDKFKNGVAGFFDFVTENGGNLKKMLRIDKSEDMKNILKTILGKDLNEVADDNEIKNAFKNIAGDEAKEKALKTFENIFKDSNNKFAKSSKVYNSIFTALSTIVLVPAFMVWLARTCDKMTRNAREKDRALAQGGLTIKDSGKKAMPREEVTFAHPNTRISMQGFLANN